MPVPRKTVLIAIVIAVVLVGLLAIYFSYCVQPERAPAEPEEVYAGGIEVLSYLKKLSCYQRFEVLFNVSGLRFSNPFNASEIDVVGYITTPSRKTLAIPAFYTVSYARYGSDVRLEERALWSLRFTPREPGNYTLVIRARSPVTGEEVSSQEVKIDVESCSPLKGFASIDSSGYLVFDDGSSEILLGINLAWPPSASDAIPFYERWFKKLEEAGVKVVRVGLVPWALSLEWDTLNRYSMLNAARLDEVVRLAEEHGIKMIFVFMWHNELADKWRENPYNAERGGPLKSPEGFWSNSVAREAFKNKVRYVIARWGYSPSILAWELVNEADLTSGFHKARDAFVEWVEDVSSYVKALDIYSRPVTISLADYNSEPRVWGVPGIDLISVHRYGPEGFKDIAAAVQSIVESLSKRYGKPVVITEFGVDYRWWGSPYWAFDREGVGLHEGLWSSALSGSPITAMSWWWDTQIEKYNLFYHFKALHEYLKSIDPVRSGLKKISALVESASSARGDVVDLVLYPSAGWIWHSPVERNVYRLYPDGRVEGDLSLLSSFVYGRWHSQKTLNPVLKVRFLEKGRMIMHINSVGSGGAKLVIYVNGGRALELELPDIDGKGEPAANEYNKDAVLELSPGEYEIEIANEGNDWFTWDYIVLENAAYATSLVQVVGLGNSTLALLWVKNRDYNWWNSVALSKPPTQLRNVVIAVKGLENGRYTVELWDTYRGTVVEEKEIEVSQGVARVQIDTLEKDVALKIYRTS